MVYTRTNREKINGLFLSGNSNWEFVFIHGYTGGVSDFADMPQTLHQKFNAEIYLPMLAGHGTKIDDIKGLTLENLIYDVEERVAKSVRNGKKVIIIGLSLGAQLALYLASKYEVTAVIAIATTHKLKFPLNIPGVRIVSIFKRKWKKIFTQEELRLRANAIFYREMLADGFLISNKLRKLVEVGAKNIRMPVLFIHSSDEQLGNPKGILELARKLSSKQITLRRIENRTHHMFYSTAKNAVVEETILFIQNLSHSTQTVVEREKVTAIIPAYNEASRIGNVIDVLSKAPSINEIIVVDDGSTDDTQSILQKFPDIISIRNKENLGKGESMDAGVRIAKNDIVFFCAADLIGFTPEHAEAIITPVLENSYDMFIGMCGDFMQRAVKAWGLNSGQRALRKKTWFELPQSDHHRFRIEVALNNHVRLNSPRGFGWKMFNYSQTLKENKYGIIRGTFLRWRMNADIVFSYAK